MKTKQRRFTDGRGRVLAMLAAIGIGSQGLTVQASGLDTSAEQPRLLATVTGVTWEAVDPDRDSAGLRDRRLQTVVLQRSVQPPSVRSRSVPPVPERTAPPRTARPRLPAHFGKLGVTRDQRATIYEIQGTYTDQIGALERKIRQLRDQQMQDVEEVLSAEQQLELKRFRAEAAKKQAERRRKSSQRRSNGDRSNGDRSNGDRSKCDRSNED